MLTYYNIDSPRCKPGTEQTSVGAVNLNSIPVKCEIEADPSDSIKFSWTYNNTRNVSPVCFYTDNINILQCYLVYEYI